MATPVRDKYFLKSLHEEIDLFDRKLAHMLKYESFATDAARKSSANKMQAKRDQLAQTARLLASEGIEFKDTDLPRSFRPSSDVAETVEPIEPAQVAAEIAAVEPPAERPASRMREFPSPFAGTVLDGRPHVEAYKRTRTKLAATASTGR